MKLPGVAGLATLALILAVFAAEAATFQVTNDSDSGPGSLRDAITQANSTPGTSTIKISVQGSIVLLSPLPDLPGDIVITGPGADKLVIFPAANTSAQTNPIFLVDAGAVVSINGVSLGALGSTINPANGGLIITRLGQSGAVINRGALTLANCVLSGNSAPQFGGAILNFGDLVVRQSTLSDNIAQGELSTGGNAFGGAIANLGNLWIINSTITGNQAAAVDGISGDFLSRKNSGIADQTDSEMYYEVVDPNNTRQTLGAWWATNGFDPDGSSPGGATAAQATYLNNNDLGFGRDMHILQQGGNVASYVSNYTLSLDHSSPDQNPLSADAAEAKDPARAVATVCMEYSPIDNDPIPTPVVKFFVFNGTGSNAVRVAGADLDGNGQKFTPQLCIVCHGGTPPPSHGATLSTVRNMHSSFREFDIASFKFPRPGTRVDDPSRSVPTASEETAFKDLNQLVFNTSPAPAIQELITGWYDGGALSTQNTSFVPPGWVDAAHPEKAQLYRNVVATSCRTCHVAQQQALDFSTYTGFTNLRASIQFDVLGALTKVMPHAKVTFANFWREGRANTLANFSGPNWAAIGTGNITGNQGFSALGGAIYGGNTIVIASTIALNTAVAGIGTSNGNADAGGFRASGTSSSIGNGLIADNFVHDALFGSQDLGGSISSQGFNLIGNTSGVTITNPQPNDITDIPDPGIAPLALNSGTTPTHALLPGSPAIDQGGAASDPVSGDPIARDQRGYVRTSTPDIGAFEFAGTVPKALGNISTRGFVQTGNDVLIGGLIISGNGPKQVILRALGPTLGQPPFNVPNALANPTLELRDGNGVLIVSNDNWEDAANSQAISDSGFAPPKNLESAILASLDPGNYTAIVRGVNNTTGIALVEGYDLDLTAGSKFGNISTRGFVGTGANVIIAGVIVHGPDSENVIVRGLGPTLAQFGVPNVLADPILDLRDGNGNLLMTNDNWKDSQESEIQASGRAPPDGSESAIARTLAAGNYTAILRGQSNTTGNGLIEVYELN